MTLGSGRAGAGAQLAAGQGGQLLCRAPKSSKSSHRPLLLGEDPVGCHGLGAGHGCCLCRPAPCGPLYPLVSLLGGLCLNSRGWLKERVAVARCQEHLCQILQELGSKQPLLAPLWILLFPVTDGQEEHVRGQDTAAAGQGHRAPAPTMPPSPSQPCTWGALGPLAFSP